MQENIWNTSTNQGECGESGVFGEDKRQIVCHGQAEEKRRCIGNGAELGRSYVDESVGPDMEKEIGVCPVLSWQYSWNFTFKLINFILMLIQLKQTRQWRGEKYTINTKFLSL